MILMRFMPAFIELGLLIFCLIDCIQTDRSLVRNLDKGWWIFLIIFMPVIGGIAWLVAGRPQHARQSQVPWRSTQTAGFPEYERPRQQTAKIDDRLNDELARVDREHEEALKRWEKDLRERESKLSQEKATDENP